MQDQIVPARTTILLVPVGHTTMTHASAVNFFMERQHMISPISNTGSVVLEQGKATGQC